MALEFMSSCAQMSLIILFKITQKPKLCGIVFSSQYAELSRILVGAQRKDLWALRAHLMISNH